MNGNEITRGKPNPEVFLKAAHKLKLLPERCVFVDSLRELTPEIFKDLISSFSRSHN